MPAVHGQTSSTSQETDHVSQLISKLKDSDPQVRLDAIRELRDIEDTRTVEPLIASLTDANWKVRQIAATALGRTNDPRAVGPLTTASQSDSDPTVRYNATKALSKIKSSLSSLGNADPHDFVPMPKDIHCNAHNLIMSAIGKRWEPSSIGGLSCWISMIGEGQAREIPLVSGNFTDGILATVSFGDLWFKVKVTDPKSIQIEIRQDELQSFREFLQRSGAQ
jgi:hypothetical protein